MEKPPFEFDEDIVIALSQREDIFKHPIADNPFAMAAQYIILADAFMDRYNEMVAELHALGYHQFPTANSFMGSVLTERGGCCDFLPRHIIEMLAQDPVPQALDLREQALEREREERRKNSPKKEKCPPDYARIVSKRLGAEPTEWRCEYCKKEGTPELGPDGRRWHVDHRYPRVHGGDDKPDNKVLSCATCNLRKNDRTPSEFAQKNGTQPIQ